MKNKQYIELLENRLQENPIYKKYKSLKCKVDSARYNLNFCGIYRPKEYDKAKLAHDNALIAMNEFLEEESSEDNTYKQIWCDMLLEAIEKIADEKYSDVPYWIDTGSRLNVALAMLEQFKKDIKR